MKSRPAKGYSWYVSLMKVLLPVGILLTVGLGFAWPYLFSAGKEDLAEIDKTDPDIKENRMLRPQYMSTDKNGQPYQVEAEWAKQHKDGFSDLVNPHGTMVMNEGDAFDLTAKTGQYDSKGKTLNLEGNVTLTSKEGYRIVTERAHINIDDKIIEGDTYIEGEGPTGAIMGTDGFKVEDRDEGKKVITLKGRSRVVINKSALKKKKDPNAS